VYTAMVQRI